MKKKTQINQREQRFKTLDVPVGWSISEFGKEFTFLRSAQIPREFLSLKESGKDVYCLHYGDIHATYTNELLDFDTEVRIPILHPSYQIPPTVDFLADGDLIIADASEDYEGVAESIELQNLKGKKAIGGLHTIVVRDAKGNTAPGFRAYLLKHPYVKRALQRAANGLSVYGISRSNLAAITIPLPSLNEQKSIASIFSTWDKAIESLQHLLDQKELRKKALMQKLLTGKKRLPGFTEEWKAVRLGDVTKKFSRRNRELRDAKVYSVTNTNGFVLQSEHFERVVAGEDLSNYKIIKKREFAYNPARINVGSIAYFEDEIGIISSLYVCFSTTKEILDYFLAQILKLDRTKHRIGSHGEGGVRIYLWYELFAKIKIAIPSLPEQRAIANVLTAADREISLLKQKLFVLREQKKGLMQKLLTGEIRVRRVN